MTPYLKATLGIGLRDRCNCYVWAFRDSPLDLGMLKAANEAVVVTGEESTRIISMEDALAKSIGTDGVRPCQVVLPSHVTPRLDVSRLLLIYLADRFLFDSIFVRRKNLHVAHTTDHYAAKLLMMPMRDATISGPALRDAHRRLCPYILGVETCPIDHVQSHQTDSYRISHEKEILILPLMRSGEPMALRVNDAMPLAMLLHATNPSDIQPKHIFNCNTILLVDSVVSSGKLILHFVRHIRHIYAIIRIVVITGVI
ncbi:hypothetical protein NUU61_001544 [Penicillium alfredii]|uniref:Phosphoribosyltransferase domain-containing protein n=1 Tax=Penicillium alfredii TaxID=1506179 RepID=A0A9W9KM66_9EURO|nr:uncharacterized protein NUU61_001544 [Penicillium alfredii]KAJ5111914.1 hypothetical protein NUU61_001544 [Penicillium alfredii]